MVIAWCFSTPSGSVEARGDVAIITGRGERIARARLVHPRSTTRPTRTGTSRVKSLTTISTRSRRHPPLPARRVPAAPCGLRIDLDQGRRTIAKRRAPRLGEAPHLAAPQAIPVFPKAILQRRYIQHRLRERLRQPPALSRRHFETLSVRRPCGRTLASAGRGPLAHPSGGKPRPLLSVDI